MQDCTMHANTAVDALDGVAEAQLVQQAKVVQSLVVPQSTISAQLVSERHVAMDEAQDEATQFAQAALTAVRLLVEPPALSPPALDPPAAAVSPPLAALPVLELAAALDPPELAVAVDPPELVAVDAPDVPPALSEPESSLPPQATKAKIGKRTRLREIMVFSAFRRT